MGQISNSSIKDYKEIIRKRPYIEQCVAHIVYQKESNGVWSKVEHYIHGSNRESLKLKVDEYKQQIGL